MEISNWPLFIIAQCFSLAGTAFLALALFSKNKSKCLIWQLIFNGMYCISYLLLGAWTGCAVVAVSVVRGLVFLYCNKKRGCLKWPELVVIELLMLGLGIWTYMDWFSIIIIFARCFLTFGVWQKNRMFFMFSQVVASSLAIIYNIHTKNYAAIILELIAIGSAIASIVVLIKNLKTAKAGETKDFN